MKIGIMGGTFNPIHNVHIQMAKKAREELSLERVLFMVAAIPPHKMGRAIASEEDRYQMVKLGIAGMEGFSASRLELDRKGPSYTLYTLRELKQKHPEDEFYFILGGDSLFQIHTWYHPEEFIPLCKFIVFARGGADKQATLRRCQELESAYRSQFILVDMPVSRVSSTEIRELAAQGKPIDCYVPKAVAKYIAQKGLYREKE